MQENLHLAVESSEQPDLDLFREFESFQEALYKKFTPHRRYIEDSSHFHAAVKLDRFSIFNTSRLEAKPYFVEIDDEMLSKPGLDSLYSIFICNTGRYAVTQDGCTDDLNPGDFSLTDSRLTGMIHNPVTSSSTAFVAPRALWEAWAPPPQPQYNHMLKSHRTTARLARNLALEVARAGEDIQPENRTAVARQIVELISLAATEASDSLPGALHRQIRLRAIKSYVRSQLSNPDLGPGLIADHFGVSDRYVSKLFAEQDQSLMDYIWATRLTRSAEMIARVPDNHYSMKEIGFLFGFKTQSHFSKLFLKRFGSSPARYRSRRGANAD